MQAERLAIFWSNYRAIKSKARSFASAERLSWFRMVRYHTSGPAGIISMVYFAIRPFIAAIEAHANPR